MSHPKELIKCVISGATDRVFQCRPMKTEEDRDYRAACKEWIFGIPRGSLHLHSESWENNIFFREDICRMYIQGQFLLAPTFRTYLDTLVFMEQRAGLTDRDENDESPRRPWSALAPNGGPYRYVFIPFTDAARKLQEECKMQPQTADDLNYGKHPRGKDLLVGSDAFPVVECYAHPFAVATHADKTFSRRRTSMMTAQWRSCTADIVDQWRCAEIKPPQWFVDAPKFGLDDVDLSATEASGYDPSTSQDNTVREATTAVADRLADPVEPRTKVSSWLGKINLEAKPVEEESPPSPRKLRRSTRIAALSSPYASSPPEFYAPLSPIRRAPWPSARGRDPIRYTPAWAKRNGRFPTRRFSSNDWAYFQYGIALAARSRS
ncbi:hypothetical protein BD626DRAFT_84491 [Schizophyllum amplum]|uniref:Uncharacterized protein n=1 Tax=Schizophyllum amplum TaxID=97359 RepID=A0A550C8Z9_9AGAR|nr:hypothetical protein BD626DRAFT_84491 [Auriculariopsis ampla]